jgi:hypothetical protein
MIELPELQQELQQNLWMCRQKAYVCTHRSVPTDGFCIRMIWLRMPFPGADLPASGNWRWKTHQRIKLCRGRESARNRDKSCKILIIDKAFLIAKPMRKADWTRRFAAGWGSAGVPIAIIWGGQTVRSASAGENDREITLGARSGIMTASFGA